MALRQSGSTAVEPRWHYGSTAAERVFALLRRHLVLFVMEHASDGTADGGAGFPADGAAQRGADRRLQAHLLDVVGLERRLELQWAGGESSRWGGIRV